MGEEDNLAKADKKPMINERTRLMEEIFRVMKRPSSKRPDVNLPFSKINKKDFTLYHCQLYSRFLYPIINIERISKINIKGLMPFLTRFIDRPLFFLINNLQRIACNNKTCHRELEIKAYLPEKICVIVLP